MNTAMTNDQIRAITPSVFATEPWERVSDKYAFIPTIEVVDALREEGFFPTQAMQSKTRIAGKKDFTKHMLRFRREIDLNTDMKEVPELVLVNSHDRTSSYQLSAGIFRLVCSNGMIVKSAGFGEVKVNHTGNIKDDVIEGSYSIIEEMPRIMENMQMLKGINLSPEQQYAYATAAMALRYPVKELSPITPSSLLTTRRREDYNVDLWTTFNKVQENFIRGGMRGITKTGKNMSTRAISSVSENVTLNKALWVLTEEMAKLVR